MKLRLAKNSIRFRVLRSEVKALHAGKRLAETLRFGPDENACFTYALESSTEKSITAVRFTGEEVLIRVNAGSLSQWALSEQVGIYDEVDVGDGRMLNVLIEKDFACLDRTENENADTYANPKTTC